MRSKSPLALMEQMVMVLVFALAAALCLQVFVLSDRLSRRCEARDQAVIVAQNAAETLKAVGGDMATAQGGAAELLGGYLSQGVWYVNYDENWQPAADEGDWRYRLYSMGEPAPVEGLWQARIWVEDFEENPTGSEEPLIELTVAWQGPAAWQEVSGNG